MFLFFENYDQAVVALQIVNATTDFSLQNVTNNWALVSPCKGGWYFSKPDDAYMKDVSGYEAREYMELPEVEYRL